MNLSPDNIFEIFSWLPAKTICKIKTICKTLSEYSEATHFKSKQALNFLSKDDMCFIVQADKYQMNNRRIELYPLLPEEKPSSGVSYNFMRLLSKSVRVLSSSNGLFLCCTTNKDPIELFVCNPVTQSSLSIPNPGPNLGGDVNVNIVIECYKDYYILILFEVPMDLDWPTSYICKVYQSTEGVWKTKKGELVPGVRSLKFEMPVIHNGTIYFISDCSNGVARWSKYYKPYIVSYNMESGISTMLKLPNAVVKGFQDMSCNMRIFRWNKVWSSRGSICLVRLLKQVFAVWFMDEEGKRPRWTRVLKVRVKAMGLKEEKPDVKEFMIINGDLLIFTTERKVYSCGLIGERYMMVEEICEHNCGSRPSLISYSNTLRSCC